MELNGNVFNPFKQTRGTMTINYSLKILGWGCFVTKTGSCRIDENHILVEFERKLFPVIKSIVELHQVTIESTDSPFLFFKKKLNCMVFEWLRVERKRLLQKNN